MPVQNSLYVIETLLDITTPATVKVGQDVIEALVTNVAFDPTTITGAGVSQDVIEVLASLGSSTVKVSQDVVEVLCLPIPVTSTTEEAAIHGFAYVS